MTEQHVISLLEEMKENCLKASIYDDPKRNDKAEALNYAIFKLEKDLHMSDKIEKLQVVSVPMDFEYRDSMLMWHKINELVDEINSLKTLYINT